VKPSVDFTDRQPGGRPQLPQALAALGRCDGVDAEAQVMRVECSRQLFERAGADSVERENLELAAVGGFLKVGDTSRPERVACRGSNTGLVE
jgi:hypothetical protein